jgi:hypothetical protein
VKAAQRRGSILLRVFPPASLWALATCSPATTRPGFRPLPQALIAVLLAPRERAIPAVDSIIQAAGVRVKQASVLDGYVETEWYDTDTHRSFNDRARIPDLKHAVKLRCWADPYVPGQSLFTIEVAYRPRVDPSRVERDLEAVPPDSSAGRKLAQQVLDDLKKRVGTPAATTP